jgi:hypothetical protein
LSVYVPVPYVIGNSRIPAKVLQTLTYDVIESIDIDGLSLTPTKVGLLLFPLPVPLRPWHIVGLYYLTRLHVSNGFDTVLIVVDHLARMAHFLPCRESNMRGNCYMESTDYTDYFGVGQ